MFHLPSTPERRKKTKTEKKRRKCFLKGQETVNEEPVALDSDTENSLYQTNPLTSNYTP